MHNKDLIELILLHWHFAAFIKTKMFGGKATNPNIITELNSSFHPALILDSLIAIQALKDKKKTTDEMCWKTIIRNVKLSEARVSSSLAFQVSKMPYLIANISFTHHSLFMSIACHTIIFDKLMCKINAYTEHTQTHTHD